MKKLIILSVMALLAAIPVANAKTLPVINKTAMFHPANKEITPATAPTTVPVMPAATLVPVYDPRYPNQQVATQPLSLTAYHANEAGIGVASVIVSGKNDAVLIDAQFTRADAERVAQQIKASGKNLTAIYISHGDPDYYFGLEVFKKYFPNVTAYATAPTVEHIKATEQKKLDVWGSQVGDAITKNVVLPQVLKKDYLELEGQRLEIVGLNEFPDRTFVWIPSIKAVVGGINVFGDNFHLWMADDKEATEKNPRVKWIQALKKIESLYPAIVVPAHGTSASSFDLRSVKFTEDYLTFYQNALKTHKTSAELIKAIKNRYPNLIFETALQIGAKVNTGEMAW